MGFKYSSAGIQERPSLPDGIYILRIVNAVEGETKNGDDKVTVDYVIAEGPQAGKKVNYHTVTFFDDKDRPGAHIAVHYLKVIGEPWEGDFEVKPENWVGKLVKAKVYSEKIPDGRVFPKIGFIDYVNGDALSEETKNWKKEITEATILETAEEVEMPEF